MERAIGFIAIARTTFDVPLAAEMTDQVRKSLIRAGFSLQGPEGLVTGAEEAEAAIAALAGKPVDLLLLLQATFADSTLALQMTEKIKAPLLLVSGTDDQTWPAGEFCADIVARLKKAGFPYEVRHVSNENGGHQSFLPYFITAGHGGISGGTPQADARGGYRSWAETIAFLHRHLDK